MEFWEFLSRGGSGFLEVPADRWDADRFTDDDGSIQGRARPRQAAYLSDYSLEHIDAQFFGLSPKEAEMLDPQQRLLLEVAWEAFEDAGIPISRWDGDRVGVYVGGFTLDHYVTQMGLVNRYQVNQFTGTSGTLGMLSNRLSYTFDLKGPSLTIDTACSSSLVAFHYACQDLWSGRARAALVGGVNVIINPTVTVAMSKGGFLSPGSRSKAFDVSADGYARGEGAGLVVLKPLAQALGDGDRVYAVVHGSGVNQDGRTAGIVAPNGERQADLIRAVLAESDAAREDVVLIEAHGTGTALGDPTEVSALARTLGRRPDGGRRFIGSVKGNIGHQEAGAGVAGLIKAALCLYHGEATPQANLGEIHPGLPFAEAGMDVPRARTPLPTSQGTPLACINSFGFGGSNAHAILGSFDGAGAERPGVASEPTAEESTAELPTVLMLSAKSETALVDRAKDLQPILGGLGGTRALLDVAHTLACRRDALSHRAAVLVRDTGGAISALESLVEKRPHPDVLLGDGVRQEAGPVFVYSGMGPQWWAMGRELYEQEPVFRDAVEAADGAFQQHSGWSVLQEMLADEHTSRMTRNEVAQPANFLLQHGLTTFLAHCGVEPAAVVGHSVGEVGAALASGALTLTDAALVAFHRSRLQQTRAGQGRLLATGLDLETAQELLGLYGDELSIAAVNSPTSVGLAGEETTLTEIARELTGQGIFNKVVYGEVAYHSHQMDGLETELRDCLAALNPRPPRLPLFSTVLGGALGEALLGADHWWSNVRKPVLFHQALLALSEAGYRTFVEVGPHPVLSGAIEQTFAASGTKPSIHASLVRFASDGESLYRTMAGLWCAGHDVNWDVRIPGRSVDLPTYPWQRERLWQESRASLQARLGRSEHPYLGVRTSDPLPSWEASLGSSVLTPLRDHVLEGRPVFPAAAYIEAFLAATDILHPDAGFGIADVRFDSMFALGDQGTYALRTDCVDDRLTLYARSLADDGEWRPYAHATIVRQKRTSMGRLTPPGDTPSLEYGGAEAYARLGEMGLDYQGAFQTIESATVSGTRVKGVLRIPDGAIATSGLRFPPSLVDGGLQLLALGCAGPEGAPLPVAVEDVACFQSTMPHSVRVVGELDASGTGRLVYLAEDGAPVLELTGIRMKRIPGSRRDGGRTGRRFQAMEWREFEQEIESISGPVPAHRLVTFGSQAPWLQTALGADPEEAAPAGPVVGVFVAPDQFAPEPRAALGVIEAAQSLEASGSPSQLVVVTQNAWRVSPTDRSVPGSAALWGVARTLRREKPRLGVTCVDLDDRPESRTRFLRWIDQLPRGAEIAIRGGKVFLREVTESASGCSSMPERLIPVPADMSAELEIPAPRSISGLRYRVHTSRAPVGDEIEVRFESASLNFKDVLKAVGRISEQSLRDTFFGDSVGMETTGVVLRTGPDSDFETGERIILGLPTGTILTRATFSPSDAYVLRWGDLPLTPHEMAVLPVSFATAHYGLLDVGQLKKGETVLLHSATGGVGHAAIQVARAVGARIFATGGTEEKRDYLRAMGVETTFDSRSLDFEHGVLDATEGRGVDVVLNFLPDALLHASLRVLAPFGRLVEIGKADIGANKGLPLAEFERNLTFGAVDIDRMVAQRRDIFYRVAREVKERLDRGDYRSLPVEKMPADNVVEAFRSFGGGTQFGKRTLDLRSGPTVALPPRLRGQSIKADAAYVVTGGHGGFGLETAKWLAAKGATHIVLLSRSVPSSTDLDRLRQELSERGGHVASYACDVGDAGALNEVFDEIGRDAPPVRGIFHAAAVLHDAPVGGQTEEHFRTAYHAKALGALNLHQVSATLGLPLDHFVLYSSVSGMLGNAGQANYAAANVFLDALAEHRRGQGLPATSIAWGAVAEAGMVARDEAVARHLEARGIHALSLARALDYLDEILAGAPATVGAVDVRWDRWSENMVLEGFDPATAMVERRSSSTGTATLAERLISTDSEGRVQVIRDFLRVTIGRLLYLDPDKVPLDVPLPEMGVDSLMSVDLELALEQGLGSRSGMVQLNAQDSLAELAARVADKVADTQTEASEVKLEELSDGEVDTMLKELLQESSTLGAE